MNIEQIPAYTGNYWHGRSEQILGVALHNTGGTNIQSTINWFQNPASQVSAHYVVGQDGRIVQMVQLNDLAYHVGIDFKSPAIINSKNQICQIVKDKWGDNPNNYLIGIECVGLGGSDLTEAQYQAVAYIISTQFKITVDRYHIVGHFEINPPARPTDAKNINYQKLINLILNPAPMTNAQIAHDGMNLLGHPLTQGQLDYEINAWLGMGQNYGKWYEGFRANQECQAFDVSALNAQLTGLQQTVKDQAKTIADQLQLIKEKDATIAELNKTLDMKDEQIATLTQQLNTCMAGNTKPDWTINIFGLKILIIKKK